MSKERADLGFTRALDEFNPADWTPKQSASTAIRPPSAATRKAAAAAGFTSREPRAEALVSTAAIAAVAPQTREGQGELRRRRTGRNTQFNLKARPETIAAFIAIADRQGWGLGETLEHAIAALEREYRVKV